MYPSTYLKGADLEEPSYDCVIAAVTMEEVTNSAGETDRKPVVTFTEPVGSGQARKLILNKTNLNSIEALLDMDETDGWIGEGITIVRESWQGKPVVRIAH